MRSRSATSSAGSGFPSRTFTSVPFYVYAYAFGQLLVLSLYQQYQAGGRDRSSRAI